MNIPLNGARPENERRRWTRLPLAIPVFVRGGAKSIGGAMKALAEFFVFLQQVLGAGHIGIDAKGSACHRFGCRSSVRNGRVLTV